ncbi:hypothetical protein LEP1GSC047_3217 [Leptospira inadai serovar Lyme str. 10]|uniref:Uncharacterized protein n=1 Tax=Leptospira inadai serovar Lyme str. 10 TaxID=1049790 RepID=V6HJB7_9LEPT|nr:hypothetical protein LEP1GSC047_3217 [Leptospira inadai serovar Lyme str. 10]
MHREEVSAANTIRFSGLELIRLSKVQEVSQIKVVRKIIQVDPIRITTKILLLNFVSGNSMLKFSFMAKGYLTRLYSQAKTLRYEVGIDLYSLPCFFR